MKSTNNKKNIILLSLILVFLAVTFFGSNSAMAGTSSKYKQYKNKFKNHQDKRGYQKTKWLKKHDTKSYFYYKSFCATHKSDIEKLSIKDQKMCKEFSSFKGYKKYLYYKKKHEANNEERNTFTCGTDTIKDADNNEYNTTNINGQCWMAKNINVGTKLSLGTTNPANNGTIEKWCYDNDSTNCDTDGGLYNWNEAMQYSSTERVRGICPAGWHIPTDAEYYALENYLKDAEETCDANRSGSGDCSGAGNKLKNDLSVGFLALETGYQFDGSYAQGPGYDYFWSSSAYSDTNAWGRYLSTGSGIMRGTRDKNYGFSVRCLKD